MIADILPFLLLLLISYVCGSSNPSNGTSSFIKEWIVQHNRTGLFNSETYTKLENNVSLAECLNTCMDGPVWPNCIPLEYGGRLTCCQAINYFAAGQTCYLITGNLVQYNLTQATGYDFYYLGILKNECSSPLVWPNFPVQVDVSASSKKSNEYDIVYADLNGEVSAWQAYDDNLVVNQYIQVDFHSIANIAKISTKGGVTKLDCYVTKYRLLFTNDTRWWQVYDNSSSGEHMEFPGNEDRYSIKTFYLKPAIVARFVRIESIEAQNGICVKFEFYGCIVATDERNYCSVITRGSTTQDPHKFGYIEVNGHPYLREQNSQLPNFEGIYLLAMDPDLCQADSVSVYRNNEELINKISSFRNGTVLIGVSNNVRNYTLSLEFFASMGLQKFAEQLKGEHTASSFITKVGYPHSSKTAEVRYGPVILVKFIESRKTQGYSLNSVIPNPIASWPFTFSSQFQDISNNNHLNFNGNSMEIQRSNGTWNFDFANFDGTGSLTAEINGGLQLKEDFTIILAVRPFSIGSLLSLYNDATMQSNASFNIRIGPQNTLSVLKEMNHIVMESTEFYNSFVWNFIAITYDKESQIMRFFKNGMIFADKYIVGSFSGATQTKYISLGNDGVLFKGDISCLQIFNEWLSSLQIQKLIHDCRRSKNIFQDLSESKVIEGPLGMMDGFITTSQYRVSSYKPVFYSKRFYGDNVPLYTISKSQLSEDYDIGCWRPLQANPSTTTEYIEVKFDIIHEVTGFVFRGCPGIETTLFTSHILVEYKLDLQANWTIMRHWQDVNNMTVSLNYDVFLAVKAVLLQPVNAVSVRLWVHNNKENIAAQFEIIGKPIDLNPLSIENIASINVSASNICPSLHMTTLSDVMSCVTCTSPETETWWILDLISLFVITSIRLNYENAGVLEFNFQKKFYGYDWDDFSEKPHLQREINNNMVNDVYYLVPAIRTRYLKIDILNGNTRCVGLVLHGNKLPGCPHGSFININNKCVYFPCYMKSTYFRSEKVCESFNWATPGRLVIANSYDLRYFLVDMIESYMITVSSEVMAVGMEAKSIPTARWKDNTTAQNIFWKSLNPDKCCAGINYEAIIGNRDEVRMLSLCETTSSDFYPQNNMMTIMTMSSFKLFLDGVYMGYRELYPWILHVEKNLKVIAVEASVNDINIPPGILVQLSDGTVSDSSWKCSNILAHSWAETDFDDSDWTNAIKMTNESYPNTSYLIQNGFKDIRNNTSWIWTKNFTEDRKVYCRKTLNSNLIKNGSNVCRKRWTFRRALCMPGYYHDIAYTANAFECIEKCLKHAVINCTSIDFDKNDGKCYMRSTTNRSAFQVENFVPKGSCLHFELWCSNCSRTLVRDLFPQGLVTLVASDETTQPANNSILYGYSATFDFIYWQTNNPSTQTWIEAKFKIFIKCMAIITYATSSKLETYHVYFLDPQYEGYRAIRNRNNEIVVFYTTFKHHYYQTINVLEESIVTKAVRLNFNSWVSGTEPKLNFDVIGCVLKDYSPSNVYLALGMASGDIGLSQITATNFQHLYYPPYARLFNDNCWKPSGVGYNLKVDLLIDHYITAINIQGCPDATGYIEKIKVHHSSNGSNWNKTYQEDGITEVEYDVIQKFDGNFISTIYINPMLRTRHLRIKIVSFTSGVQGMRVEIFGKPVDCASINGFNIESISGTEGLYEHELSKALLQNRMTNPYESWCPNVTLSDSPGYKPYVIVELESLYLATSFEFINTSGVQQINIDYSPDGEMWKEYLDERLNKKEFSASENTTFYFQRLLPLKSIKITLQNWFGQPCLRISLHACKASACPPNSVQFGKKCYWHTMSIKGNYNKADLLCRTLKWSRTGNIIEAKNTDELSNLISLVYPNSRANFLQSSYTGLKKIDGKFRWANGTDVIDPDRLPFTTSPTQECTAIGDNRQKFVSVPCNFEYEIFCEVPSSVSKTESTIIWLQRIDFYTTLQYYLGNIANNNYDVIEFMQHCLKLNCKTFIMYPAHVYFYGSSINAPGIPVYAYPHLNHYIYERYIKEPDEVNLVTGINPNTSVKASSFLDINHGTNYAIFNDPSFGANRYWRAAGNNLVQPWIEINFEEIVMIKRLTTIGAYNVNYYSTLITITSTINGNLHQVYYGNPAEQRQMYVNTDYVAYNSRIETALVFPIYATEVRIRIDQYAGLPVLRIAFYGTKLGNTSLSPVLLSLAAGKLPDGTVKPSQLYSRSNLTMVGGKWYSPFNAEIGAVNEGYLLAGWLPQGTANQFVQIQFEGLYIITHIITQGVGSDYVTSFSVMRYTSNMLSGELDKTSGGSTMLYKGYLEPYITLLEPNADVHALRIYVNTYVGKVALRFNVAGYAKDCPLLSTDLAISDGSKIIEPCFSNASLTCTLWCSKEEHGKIQISLNFKTSYSMTGFVLRSRNETYSKYHLNIVNNGLWYSSDIHKDKYASVVKVNSSITDHGSYWQYKLSNPIVFSSFMMNVTGLDLLDCVQLEIHACSVGACPPGFAQYRDKCYYYQGYVGVSNSYFEGTKTCNSMPWGGKGSIVLPEDTETNYFIHSLVSRNQPVFLGINFDHTSSSWLDAASNTSLKFSHWDNLNGDPISANETCAQLVGVSWQNKPCNIGGVICQTDMIGNNKFEWFGKKNVKVSSPNDVPFSVVNEIVDVPACLQICSRQEWCKSVIMGHIHQCFLYKQTRYDPGFIVSSGDLLYFEKWEIDDCQRSLLQTFSYQITSSSDLDSAHSKYMLPMDMTLTRSPLQYWQPERNGVYQWIQVTFPFGFYLNQLVISRSNFIGGTSFVTKFKLEISNDMIIWNYIKNELDMSEVFCCFPKFLFPSTPFGRAVKLQPLEWVNNITMQIKMYGCPKLDVLPDCWTSTSETAMKCFNNWNIILEHKQGELDFRTSWENFTIGFYNEINNEYYMGNSLLYNLTENIPYVLRIDMWLNNNEFIYSEYDYFAIKSEADRFEIEISNFTAGLTGDGGLIQLNGSKFYTAANNSCALQSPGGFWYKSGDLNFACNDPITRLSSYPDIFWKDEINNISLDITKVVMRMQSRLEQNDVAFQKVVYQSSIVVEQSMDPTYKSCAVTQNQSDPYWLVDLGKVFKLSSYSLTIYVEITKELNIMLSEKETNTSSPDFSKFTVYESFPGGNITYGETLYANFQQNVTARYFAVKMIGEGVLKLCRVQVFATRKVEAVLFEACGWDDDCTITDSQCLPVNKSSMALEFTCQCKKGYMTVDGKCKATVDLSLNMTTETHLVRGVAAIFTVDVEIINNADQDIYPASSPDVNFNISLSLRDSENVWNSSHTLTYFPHVYQLGSPMSGINASSKINVTITYEVFFTTAQCSDIKYLCLDLWVPKDALYIDTNNTNNKICENATLLVLCRPSIDVELAEVYTESIIVRNLSGPYNFTAVIGVMPDSLPITVPLDGGMNFQIKFALSNNILENGTSLVQSLLLQTASLRRVDFLRSFYDPNVTINITAAVSTNMNFSTCNDTKYICFIVMDDLTATYKEMDYFNNLKCVDIAMHLECYPALPLSIMELSMNSPTIIRGYNTSINFSILLWNNHSHIPVAELTELLYNYNVTMYTSENDLVINNSSSVSLLNSLDIPLIELQNGIQPNQGLYLNGKIEITVPRTECGKLNYLCTKVSPTSIATFKLLHENFLGKCTSVSEKINCLGLQVENVTFVVEPMFSAIANNISFIVSWEQGTDVNYTVNFGDNTTFEWNWKIALHTENFGQFHSIVSHMYDEIGNYNATLKIGNEVQEETKSLLVIVEPYLPDYINITAVYTPSAVPVEVSFRFQNKKSYLGVPIWVNCTAEFGYEDGYKTEDFMIHELYSLNHTFLKDKSHASVSLLCHNHLNNITFESKIILRQEVTGLQIAPENHAYATNHTSKFHITMHSGSHILLNVDFGDGTSGNYSNVNIYSYSFTWIIDHVYTVNNNYTVRVNASNEYFSSVNQTEIIIQNHVPSINLSTISTNIKYPDGITSFSITAAQTRTLPDQVFCQWNFDENATETVYSIPLMSGYPDTKQHIYTRNSIGLPVNVEVICFNLVSSSKADITVQIYEEIAGLNIVLHPKHYHTSENITFELILTSGSNVMYQIDYGDGNKEILFHQEVFSVPSVFIRHQYSTIGNYSVNVTASNPVTYESTIIEPSIIIQNRIVHLNISTNETIILWPQGIANFVIYADINQKVLHNVFCKWNYSENSLQQSYHQTIDQTNPVKISHQYPKSSIGIVTVNVRCFNLISHIDMNHSFEIVLDEVRIDTLLTNDWVWWTNASNFNLTLLRYGSNSCFEWDMGDGKQFMYGVSWCEEHAKINGLQLQQVEPGLTVMYKQYTYNTWGNFVVTLTAFNHVNRDTVSIVAVVKEWYCYKPNITYASNLTSLSNVQSFMRSKNFSITPYKISIDCMKSFNKSESTLKIYNIDEVGNNAVLTYANASTFYHPPRLLQYGKYAAVLNLSMLGVPSASTEARFYFNIIKSPLDIHIKGAFNVSVNLFESFVLDTSTVSFDPDVDPALPQGIVFEWACRQFTETFPVDTKGNILPVGPSETLFDDFNGCFGGGPGRLPNNTGVLEINTGDMMPNKQYMFKVTAVKDTRMATAEKIVNLIPPKGPDVVIRCRENCGSLKSLSTSMVLKADCQFRCKTKYGSIRYMWQLEWEDNNTTNAQNLSVITVQGDQAPNLYIKPWSLKGGKIYTATLTVWTPGSLRNVLKETFHTNIPPTGGSCTVTPLKGYASSTLFTFTCINWKVYQFPGKKDRLKYEYRVKSVGSKRSFLIYFGLSMTSEPSFLPMGNYEEQFLNELELYIVDDIGDYFKFLKNVTVLHPLVSKKDVVSQMLSDISLLQQKITNKNYQAAAGAIYASASLLNMPASVSTGVNDDTNVAELMEERTKIRTAFINMVSNIQFNSTDGLLQTNAALTSLVLQPKELTVDSQQTATDKLNEMEDFYVKNRADLNEGKKFEVAYDLTSSSVLVIIAGDDYITSATNSSENSTISSYTAQQKVKSVMQGTVNVIDKITDAVLSDKEVDDPPDVMDLESVIIMLGKSKETEVSNATYQTSLGNVKLPELKDILPGSNGECVTNNLMFSSINTYTWANSSNNVNSAIASFTLTDCSNNTARRKRAINQDISYEVELDTSVSPLKVNITISEPDQMVHHHLNLSTEPKPTIITVYPVGNESLKIFVEFDSKPSLSTFNFTFQVPKNNVTIGNIYDKDYSFYIPVENITGQNISQINVGVVKKGCVTGASCESLDSKSMVYSYIISEMQCQVWDSIMETWTSDGCQLLPESTPSKVRFKSNLFGSLGGGVFVGPNIIDFSTLFDNLGQKLADNAAVVGTVISLLVLYIPLLVLCRYFDKKDHAKWMILPLTDNHPVDKYAYELHIYTGLMKNAGTGSKVSMILAGTETDTGIRILEDGKRKNFQRGNVTSFLMKAPYSLGIPVTLKIWHDNSGIDKTAGWNLSKIIVVDIESGKWYLFMCEDWLSADESDGRIERILKIANSDELSEHGSALLQSNITKKMFDDHIWLSIGYRATRSNFTRAQRLSCCLAILFLTMVSNAMWYGTGSSESSQTAFSIGPISFTVHQLYTSLMSSVIVVPPILFITVLFSKSSARKKKLNDDGTPKAQGAMEREEHRSKKKKLPFWCIYVAYFFVTLSVAAGAFFTISYALQWGKEKSTAWLITFVLSFFQSLLFVQPLKVLVIATLLTFLFKKDSDTSSYEDDYGKMEGRNDEWLPANKEILKPTMQLSREEIEFAKKRKEFDKKLRAMMKEIVWNILFIILLLYVANGNQDGNVYFQNEDLKTRLISTIEVTSKENIWEWFNTALLPTLYYNEHYNGMKVETYDKRFIDNAYAMRLGPPRLRQLRVKSEKCKIPKVMNEVITKCTVKFTEDNEDTSNHSIMWGFLNATGTNNIQGNNNAKKSFLYTSPKQMDGIKFWGRLQWYPSGGYLVNLGEDLMTATDMVESLKNDEWIDRYTRVVFVEFNVWNANSNLFNMFMLSFEFLPFGGVFIWSNIDSINLYRYSGSGGLINLLAELSLTVFVLVLTIIDIVKAIKSKGRYFKEFWNIVNILCYTLYYTALGLYVWRSLLTVKKIEEVMNNKGKTINFQLLTLANVLFMNLISLMTYLVILRLIHILRYNKTLSVIGATLHNCANSLIGMFTSFGIIFIAFTTLCYGILHGYLESFSSLHNTMSTLCSAFLGAFEFTGIVEVAGMFGGIILLVYLLTTMVFIMNVFVALLNEFMAAVQRDPDSLSKDYEVAEYLTNMLKSAFSSDKVRKKDQKVHGLSNPINCDDDLTLVVPTISLAMEQFLDDFIKWKTTNKIKTLNFDPLFDYITKMEDELLVEDILELAYEMNNSDLDDDDDLSLISIKSW